MSIEQDSTDIDDAAPSIALRTARALRARQATDLAPDPVDGGSADATDTAAAADPDAAETDAAETDAADTADADTADADTADADTAVADTAVADTDVADTDVTDDEPPAHPPVRRRPSRSRDAATRSRSRRRPARATLAAAAVTVAALVFAVVAAVLWWQADRHSDSSADHNRDAALQAAGQAVVALNTADYRHPDAALAQWKSVSTGTLAKEFAAGGTDVVTALRKARLVTSATVQDAAVTALDVSKGTATVIASVYLKRQPVTGAATTSRNRFRATLARVDGRWRLADLAPVSVQLG